MVFLAIPSRQSAEAHSIKSLLGLPHTKLLTDSLTSVSTVFSSQRKSVYACKGMHAHVLCVDSWISVCVHAWTPDFRITCLQNSTYGMPCVQHFSSLVICLWPLHSPKMTLNDHYSFASRTWEGFCGQVIKDATRIWTEAEEKRRTEKENRCLTFQSWKKLSEWAKKNISRYRCCFARPLIWTWDATISWRYKLFASKHPVDKKPTENPLMAFTLLHNHWLHPTACAWSGTDKHCEWKKSRKQTNSRPLTG